MDDVLVLINQIGPLPISIQFQAPADGSVSFFLAASAWTQTAGSWLSVGLELDGVPISSVQGFANQADVHQALVPAYITTTLTAGEHTLSLLPGNPTTIGDINDFFHVSLHL